MCQTADMIHAWEAKGLGKAPFRFVGMFSFPSKGLAEANPDAYMNACRECSEIARGLGVSGGICEVCGQCLMNNFAIESADNRRFVVGCDCVAKTGDAGLISRVKLAEKRRKRAAQEVERKARWEAERPEREAREKAYAEAEAKRRQAEIEMQRFVAEQFSWLVNTLRQVGGNFAENMAAELQGGRQFDDFSWRCQAIIREIWAKQVSGKRVSTNAYTAAADQFNRKVWQATENVAQFRKGVRGDFRPPSEIE